MSFVDPTDGSRNILQSSPGRGGKVTLAGTVKRGDSIGYSSGWKQADSDAPIYAQLVALQSGVSGDVITVGDSAVIDFGSGCTATPGDKLYLSNTAGTYATTPGTTAEQTGVMLDAQVGMVWAEHGQHSP